VQLRRPFRQSATAFPSTRKSQHHTEKRRCVSFLVQGNSKLGCGARGGIIAAEEQGRRERGVRKLVRRREFYRAARRRQCPVHGIGPLVESVRVFGAVQPREHGPAIGVVRRLLYRALQGRSAGQVLGRADMLVKSEAAQQRLVGRKRFWI